MGSAEETDASGAAASWAWQPAVIKPSNTNERALLPRGCPLCIRFMGDGEVEGVLLSFVPRAARDMPKLKTRKAAAKRFKATGTGKFMRRRAFRNHLLDHKSPKLKRHLGTKAVVDRTDEERVALMMPYA